MGIVFCKRITTKNVCKNEFQALKTCIKEAVSSRTVIMMMIMIMIMIMIIIIINDDDDVDDDNDDNVGK